MVKRKAQTQGTSVKAFDFVKQIEDHPRFFWYYAAATLVFIVVLFNKFIFSNAMLYGSDTINAGIYFREFMVDYYKAHGSVPMWSPYIFCGMPFVDAFHGDIFYPLTFPFKMLLPLQRALGWGLILHIYLAGIFAYICARGFGLSKVASAFAGVSYMFAGFLVSWVAPGHDGKIFVATLFPLAFHFLNRGTATLRLKWFLLLGLTIALIILTPHPQMAYFTLWALGGFFVYRLVFMFRDKIGTAKMALTTAPVCSGCCNRTVRFGNPILSWLQIRSGVFAPAQEREPKGVAATNGQRRGRCIWKNWSGSSYPFSRG